MRLFLATLTLGAAGIGYAFIQSDLHSAETPSATPSLFDWQSASDPIGVATNVDTDSSPAVTDAINKTRSEITSTLDEFVRSNVVPDPEPLPAVASDIVSKSVVSQTQHLSADDSAETIPASSPPVRVERSQEEQDIGPAGAAAAVESAVRRSEPADASDVVASPPATQPEELKTGPSKPSINEATLLSKKPTIQDADAPQATSSTSSSPRNTTELLPGKLPQREKKIIDSGWTTVAKTTNDLPMHKRLFGRDGSRTLVMAGLDGQDLIAVRWNDQLADALARQGDLYPANEVLIFRAGNPDGLVKVSSANAHGVLINRNFPSRRYQLLPDKSSGAGPVSEAETRAILDVMYNFRPRRVIHLMSTNGKSKVYYNRSAKEIAAELQQEHKLETQPLDVELVPGSLEDFSDGTLDAAVITMQLSGGADWQQAWNKHLPAVLTAINGHNPARLRPVSSEGTRIPDAQMTVPPEQKTRRGYEELPAPPRT